MRGQWLATVVAVLAATLGACGSSGPPAGGAGGASSTGGAGGEAARGSTGSGGQAGMGQPTGGAAGQPAGTGGNAAGGSDGTGGRAGASGTATGGAGGVTAGGGEAGGAGRMASGGGVGGGGHPTGGAGGAAPNRKAVLVGLPTAVPTAGDTVMAGRLKALGFAVTFAGDKTVTATSVAGADLILISSSAESGNLGTRLRDVAIPIFCVENGQYPNQGMTPSGVGSGEDSVLSQTAVTIAAAASPLAGGLTGNVTISSKAGELGWGAPPAAASVAATIVGQANHAAIFGFAKGDQMVGMTAPARRAGFAIREDLAANLSTNGIALFDSIVAWVTQ